MGKVPITLVATPKEAKAVLDRVYPTGMAAPNWSIVGVDTEYDPNEPREGRLAYFQISNGSERIVIDGPLTSKAKGRDYDLPKLFKQWLRDSDVKKVLSTTGADWRSLRDAGCGEMRGIVFDTEVGDWLLDENRMYHGLKDCAKDHLNLFMRSYEETFGFLPEGKKKAVVPSMKEIVEGKEGGHDVPWTGATGRAKAEQYAALDPYASLLTYKYMRPKLEEEGLWDWYREVERPFTSTLLYMEDRGIRIDLKAVREISKRVACDLLRNSHTFRALVSKPDINLRSNPQLCKLFFEELDWPILATTPTGNPSLDAEVLRKLEGKGYKLAGILREHKGLATMKSTFLDNFLSKTGADSILHTKFWQARVVTGRLSSGARRDGLMNLQNIPARKEKDPYGIRRLFLPTKKGYKLIVADYSQIELYIIAQLSGDKRMIEAFGRGEDLHMLTCSEIFGIKLPKPPKSWDASHPDYKRWKKDCEEWKEKYADKRVAAKAVNFGINYGLSAWGFSQQHNVDEDEAQTWIDGYFRLYPGVAKWRAKNLAFAKKHGYVLTIANRKRRLADVINHPDDGIRRHAENMAANAPIQGAASDIIKVAMNAVEYGARYKTRFATHVPEADKLKEWGVEQLLQVHDEIVLQVPEKHADKAVPIIKKVMEAPFPHVFKDVRIKAAVKVGDNWMEGKG